MRKRLLPCFLLLAFILCSCGNSSEKTDKEWGGAEAMLTVPAIILPMPAGMEEPAGEAAISAVFLDELFTAPGTYADVPDLYAPVLDDLYLRGVLSRRYRGLQRDGKITRAVIDEYEAVFHRIRSRGHLTYRGDGGGTGYLLADLDGDHCPELLILSMPSHMQRRQPRILAIFAIRNGQLVRISDDSYKLELYTFLAADGTFYQYIPGPGAGYANLTAFRLETGMSTFTNIIEARASLSFSDGDVPVPYWVKTENGEETDITEDEFKTLVEQFSNPQELMALDFVLLPPYDDEHWPAPQPEEAFGIAPVDFPPSYPDAPSAYKLILDDLYLFAERIRRGDSIGESIYDDWFGRTGITEFPRDTLGYAVADINNDGILELLIGTQEGLIRAAPCSIFTLKDGEPVLLVNAWSRYSGAVSADGTLYFVGSGGAAYTYLSSYRLDKHAYTLTRLTYMASDYSDKEQKPYYYQVVDGRNHYIPEYEFWRFLDLYVNPPEIMPLTFIPILD